MAWEAAAPIVGPARPQLVTAAGVILIVLGAIQALAGLVLMTVSPEDLAGIGSIGTLDSDGVARGIGLISVVIGLLEILAGILVLRLSEGGRILSLVIASLGLLGGIGSLSGGNATGVLTLGLYAFVVYALFSKRSAFRRARQG